MEKDLELINEYIKEIRNKIKIVQEQNINIKDFNYKLAALLDSLDSYSVNKKDKEGRTSKIPVLRINEKRSIAESIKNEALRTNIPNKKASISPVLLDNQANLNRQSISIPKNTETMYQSGIPSSDTLIPDTSNINLTFTSFNNRDDIFNDLLSRAFLAEGSSKLNRSNIIKVLELLYKNKDGMLLDDVLKLSGISKYKCIDVLNFFIKIDPPIVTKKFDKGFIYCIKK